MTRTEAAELQKLGLTPEQLAQRQAAIQQQLGKATNPRALDAK